MSLRDFMDASIALLTEEHQRIEPLKDFISVREQLLPSDTKVERVPRQADVTQQNEQAVAALQAMMAGKQNNPLAKLRKA